MLTRSPVPPSPVNVSPRSTFQPFHHHAAASSPRQSPPRVSLPVPRRQSSSSASGRTDSPIYPRPRRYVGVDAATQYSPMELASNPPAGQPGQPPQQQPSPPPPLLPGSSEKLETPPTPGPKPMTMPADIDGDLSQVQRASATSSKVVRQPDASQSASDHKRRNSQGPGATEGEPSQPLAQSPSTLSKRVKPDTATPKLLPQKYEQCAVEDMVVLISNMLGELIETNDALALKAGHLTRFHSRTAPGISVLDYLHRLAKHATLSPPLLLSMVYYIDRLCVSYPDFTINTLTVHRFLITAATVAAKGLSDSFWNNSTYARVGGVRVAELVLLELEFLYRVDWKIVPNPEVLVAYYRGLVERCPGYKLQEDRASVEEDEDSENIDDDDEIDVEEDDVEVDSQPDEGSDDSIAPNPTSSSKKARDGKTGEQ